METIRLAYPIPYHAQVASPELAAEFFEHGRALESDPRWAETGATSPQEYAHWADRSCGVVCVKMIVEAFGGPCLPLMSWVEAGIANGGYLTRPRSDGSLDELGWKHDCLAQLILPYAAQARAAPASPLEIASHLADGCALIASISYEIGTHYPITRRGGHLVVVTGADLNEGQPVAFYVHNPSGRSVELRLHARIPIERFINAYTGRVIVAEPTSSLLLQS